jgi:hypothetical protein
MPHQRTTHRDEDGCLRRRASEHDVVWVSLQDPSLEELATLGHEYAMPELLPHELAFLAGSGIVLQAVDDNQWGGHGKQSAFVVIADA